MVEANELRQQPIKELKFASSAHKIAAMHRVGGVAEVAGHGEFNLLEHKRVVADLAQLHNGVHKLVL